MNVRDLLKILLEKNLDAEVIVTSSNFELNGAKVAVSSVNQYDNGSTTKERFRDAFDGGSYSESTYSIVGGDIPVVLIS